MRHGATPWNAGGRFQGSSDVGLSDVGIAQAGAISQRLKDQRIDRVYSSDLSRAVETARAVAGVHGIEPLLDARLREFDFGEWEGLTWDEIATRHPELRTDVTDARKYAPPGGETFAAVRARVRAFLDDVARDCPNHAVVVTHAGPLHAMLAELHVTPQRQPARFSPAGITEVALDASGAVLLRFDDVSHLE